MGRRNKGCGSAGRRFWGGVGRGLGYVMICGARGSLCPAAPLVLPPLPPLRCSRPPACCVVGGRDCAGRGRRCCCCKMQAQHRFVTSYDLAVARTGVGWEACAVDASPIDASYIFMMCKPAHHLRELVRQPGAEHCRCLFPPVAFLTRWRSWRGAAPGPDGVLSALLLAWPCSC